MTDHPNPCLPGCSCPNAPTAGSGHATEPAAERRRRLADLESGWWYKRPGETMQEHSARLKADPRYPELGQPVPGRPDLEFADLPMADRPIGMRTDVEPDAPNYGQALVADALADLFAGDSPDQDATPWLEVAAQLLPLVDPAVLQKLAGKSSADDDATMNAAGRRFWGDAAFHARVIRAVRAAEADQPDDGFDRFHRDSLVAGAAMALHQDDQEVAGYLIVERPVYGLHAGELVADWDGKVHETREAADAELAVANAPDSDDVTATLSDHWTLYELRAVRRS